MTSRNGRRIRSVVVLATFALATLAPTAASAAPAKKADAQSSTVTTLGLSWL